MHLNSLVISQSPASGENFYLSGAAELRNGIFAAGTPRTVSRDLISALSPDMLFDYMAVKLNGPEAADGDLVLNFKFTDTPDRYRVTVANGVLNYKAATQSPDADATISLTRQGLVALALLGRPPAILIENGVIAVEGNAGSLEEMMSLFDSFEFWFNIITP